MVAVNDAIQSAEKAMNDAMGAMTGGMKMPGMF